MYTTRQEWEQRGERNRETCRFPGVGGGRGALQGCAFEWRAVLVQQGQSITTHSGAVQCSALQLKRAVVRMARVWKAPFAQESGGWCFRSESKVG